MIRECSWKKIKIEKKIWLSGVRYGNVVKKGKFTAADQSKLVIHTDSSSEEVEDLHLDVNFDEPIDLAIY